MNRSTISEVCIEIIISSFERDDVFAIYSSTKPLIRIITRERNLYVIDDCVSSNGTKCDCVDFLVWFECQPTKFNSQIINRAAIVIIVDSAVFCQCVIQRNVVETLHLNIRTLVVNSFTAQYYSTPISSVTRTNRFC